MLQVSPAAARTHVFVGSGIVAGDPYYQPYPYYSPYYAYPYRHYGYTHYAYPPAPPYPYAYSAQPAPAQNDAYDNDTQGAYCREYTQDVIVAGREQQGYGHACMQPDGQWHIID